MESLTTLGTQKEDIPDLEALKDSFTFLVELSERQGCLQEAEAYRAAIVEIEAQVNRLLSAQP